MKIEYAIWQGNRLLSVTNTANSLKELDKLEEELNASNLAKKEKFRISIMKLEVK